MAARRLIRSGSHDGLLHALIVGDLDVEIEDDTLLTTPLIWAVSRGNVPMISALIRRGANLEAVVKSKGADGFYPPLERGIPKLNQGATPLLEAAASGQEEIVKILVDNGAKLEVTDSWGYSPLARAIQAGAKSSVKLLLDHTADMASLDWEIEDQDAMVFNLKNAIDRAFLEPSPLKNAVMAGDEETSVISGTQRRPQDDEASEGAGHLYEADYDRFPWHAPGQERTPVLRRLMENGVKVGGRSSIFGYDFLARAAADGDLGLMKLLLENGANTEDWVEEMRTLLVATAENGREAVVRFLLDRRAVTNETKFSVGMALMNAIQQQQEGTVKILCEGGADLETSSYQFESKPLHEAAGKGYVEIVKLLIEHGADLNSKSNGLTALMAAAENGRGAVVEELLQAGANPNIRGGIRFRKAKRFAKDDEVRGVFTRHGL
ncbi:ankyrin repeat-containing protein [Aspergillus sp. HF37]|nr:ankyrin repeat-containing protein [Aspergillus sp. HF37]